MDSWVSPETITVGHLTGALVAEEQAFISTSGTLAAYFFVFLAICKLASDLIGAIHGVTGPWTSVQSTVVVN